MSESSRQKNVLFIGDPPEPFHATFADSHRVPWSVVELSAKGENREAVKRRMALFISHPVASVPIVYESRAAAMAWVRERDWEDESPFERLTEREKVDRIDLLTARAFGHHRIINEDVAPGDQGVSPDPEQLAYEERIDQTFADHYRKLLRDKKRLDEAYDKLFRRALALGTPPLTLFDNAKPPNGAPIGVSQPIGNLQQHRADATWTARSCKWMGPSTLYEVTEPWSKSVAAQKRRLVLPRQPAFTTRNDLASIDPTDPNLKYPTGTGPEDFRNQPWNALAATSSW
jgi:hypothetical protein